MPELKFVEDRERLKKLAPVAVAPIRHHIFVCNGKSCMPVGSADVKKAFENELEKRDLRFGRAEKGRNPRGEIMLTDCGSVGLCAVGTAVLIYPEGVWYAQVRAADVPEIVEKHLLGGEIVERLTIKKMSEISDEKSNEIF